MNHLNYNMNSQIYKQLISNFIIYIKTRNNIAFFKIHIYNKCRKRNITKYKRHKSLIK